jgi:hypothetical protein
MREFKYSLVGLVFALTFYFISLFVDLDLFEAMINWLEKVDHIEIDEFLVSLFFLTMGFAIDIIRHQRVLKSNRDKVATLRATMRTVDDIVGNAHQSLSYFAHIASQQGAFNGQESQKFQEIIDATQKQLDELRRLDKVVEKEIIPGISMLDTKGGQAP